MEWIALSDACSPYFSQLVRNVRYMIVFLLTCGSVEERIGFKRKSNQPANMTSASFPEAVFKKNSFFTPFMVDSIL